MSTNMSRNSLLMVSSLFNKLCSPEPCLVVMNTSSCSSYCESFSSWMHRRFLAPNDFSFNMLSMYNFESDAWCDFKFWNMHTLYIYMHVYIYTLTNYLQKSWGLDDGRGPLVLHRRVTEGTGGFSWVYPNFIINFIWRILWPQCFPWIGVWLHWSLCGMWVFDSMFVLRWLHHCQLGYRILEPLDGRADVKTS